MSLFAWSLTLYLASFLRTLIHELGHAIVALHVTRAQVVVLTGRPLVVPRLGRLTLGLGLGTTGGACYYRGSMSARAEAAVAAAGPATSLLAGLAAAAGFLVIGDASPGDFAGALLAVMALAGVADAIVNGWPRTVDPARSLYGIGENDGAAVARLMGWRQTHSAPSATPLPAPARGTPPVPVPEPRPMMRTWAFVLLGLAIVLALLVEPLLALGLAVFFAIAALEQREDEHAARLAELNGPPPSSSRPPPGM